MAEFFTSGQIIESDVDMVDQILSTMQSDTYLNRALEQFTPMSESYEAIHEYNLGAAICFSYLTSLPVQYGQRQLRHLLEHAQARNQLLAGATTLGLNETATNHLLVSRISEFNADLATGVENYVQSTQKTPQQALSFLLGFYDVAGLMLRPLPSQEVA